MKTLFIELKSKQDISESQLHELEEKLPEKIFIVYNIQYKNIAEKIKNKLNEKDKKIIGFQQVLGCSRVRAKNILLVGDGVFHLLSLDTENIYIYNGNLKRISKDEIEKIKKKKKLALNKFYSADELGILVSCKLGQARLQDAIKLQKKLKKKSKRAFIFIADNINKSDLENFSIESWINTACPGLIFDLPVLNIEDLKINKN